MTELCQDTEVDTKGDAFAPMAGSYTQVSHCTNSVRLAEALAKT